MAATTTHSLEDDSGAKFDNMFLAIAEGAHGIENLMDSFFSFLARKTDFFVADLEAKKTASGKDAETDPSLAVTLRYYRKHQGPAVERHRKELESYKKIDADRRKKRLEEQTASVSGKPMGAASVTKQQPGGLTIEEIVDEDGLGRAGTPAAAPAVPTTKQTSESASKDVPLSSPLNSDKEQPSDNEEAAPVGNGGTTDKYTWTQLLPSVDVYIPLAERTIARNCKVTLTSSSLRVVVNSDVIIDGQLHQKIRPDDSLWTLEDGRTLHLVLEKVDTMRWWSCVIVGDPSISTQKIVPENSKLSDLDPELRQTVEKMMFDQEQKARGLPTSDQQRQHQVLENFKAAHPEMDFSQAKINWGTGGMSGF